MGIHIMIDLEMASVLPNGAILQLAAASFTTNPNMVCPPSRFFTEYVNDWAFAGGHIDSDTMDWWKQQAVYENMKNMTRLSNYSEANVLDKFAEWVVDEVQRSGELEIEGFWGYPSTSDLMWLECAYRRHGHKELPWKYYQARDLHSLEKEVYKPDIQFIGTKHDALYDVLHQIKKVWAIRDLLSSNLTP